MSVLVVLTLAGVCAWGTLMLIAQLVTPEQSALSMGLSGLATGRHGWIMRVAFVMPFVSALALLGAVSAGVPESARSLIGLILFATGGAGCALLAACDEDMPGQVRTSHGRLHTLIAALAYVAAGVGMLLVSWDLRAAQETAGLARWALPLALLAAVAMLAQWAALHVAVRRPDRGLGRYAGLMQRMCLGIVMLWTVVVAGGI